MNFFKNVFTFYKRIQAPVSNAKEAKPFLKEAKTYIIIFLAIGILSLCLENVEFLPRAIKTTISLLGFVGFALGAYFGYMYWGLSRIVKRMENLTCNKCGASLKDVENATWSEINREWKGVNDSNKAEAILYITVKISCKCPDCGNVKTFNEVLSSGKILVTNYAIRDTLVSTQTLVEDYFNGHIHG